METFFGIQFPVSAAPVIIVPTVNRLSKNSRFFHQFWLRNVSQVYYIGLIDSECQTQY
jgi:hypothetical protein